MPSQFSANFASLRWSSLEKYFQWVSNLSKTKFSIFQKNHMTNRKFDSNSFQESVMHSTYFKRQSYELSAFKTFVTISSRLSLPPNRSLCNFWSWCFSRFENSGRQLKLKSQLQPSTGRPNIDVKVHILIPQDINGSLTAIFKNCLFFQSISSFYTDVGLPLMVVQTDCPWSENN